MDIEVAKANLLIIKDILDANDIKFWPMCGTFLGMYRDKSLIPWDNDIDLALKLDDYGKLKECETTFVENGFKFIVDRPKENISYKRNEIGVDFLFFQKEGAYYKRFAVLMDISAFDVCNEISLWGVKWRIFSDPERWVRYIYGDDWQTPIEGKCAVNMAYGSRGG